MKKLFLTLTAVLACAYSFSFAQIETTGIHTDDKERIALTAVVLDDKIPEGAHRQLISKMNALAAKNGCAATDNSRFIITCSADVLTQDVTPTAPPMHAYTLAVNFFVGDGFDGRLFSSYSIETKGVGQTPDKAYINALKNVKLNDPGFKTMIETGKQEIIAYYNTQCDLIIADAKAKAGRNEFSEAIDLLATIPSVCEGCYLRALDESKAIYATWRDHICEMALNQARNAWATRDSKAAADALCLVPVDGSCFPQAEALREEISSKLDAKERQDWDFKMQQYDDRIAAQSASAASSSVSSRAPQQVGTNSASSTSAQRPNVSDGAQRPTPTYEVKGKWFK